MARILYQRLFWFVYIIIIIFWFVQNSKFLISNMFSSFSRKKQSSTARQIIRWKKANSRKWKVLWRLWTSSQAAVAFLTALKSRAARVSSGQSKITKLRPKLSRFLFINSEMFWNYQRSSIVMQLKCFDSKQVA